MTEQDFFEMDDRERDAVVAERVMGWHPCLGGCCWLGEDGNRTAGRLQYQSFNPTTSIAAAWQVVEKHANGVWNWRIIQNDSTEPYRQWFVEVRLGYSTSYDKAFPVWAATAPLAICIAALKAKGVIE